MKLTRGEYCQFNLRSRVQLLNEYGKLMVKKKVDTTCEMMLFNIYDFYVEVVYRQGVIMRAEPLVSGKWLDFYQN